MKTFEKIINMTTNNSGRKDFWLSEDTMNNLLSEADEIRVQGNNLHITVGISTIIVETGAGTLISTENGIGPVYYRVKSVGYLYQRSQVVRIRDISVEVL